MNMEKWAVYYELLWHVVTLASVFMFCLGMFSWLYKIRKSTKVNVFYSVLFFQILSGLMYLGYKIFVPVIVIDVGLIILGVTAFGVSVRGAEMI